MYKALLVALIGLFFSTFVYAAGYQISMIAPDGSRTNFVYENTDPSQICTFAGLVPKGSGSCQGGYVYTVSQWSFNAVPSDQCTVYPDIPACTVQCPDGTPAPNGDIEQCPAPLCPDGSPAPVGDVLLCSTEPDPDPQPVECWDGSQAPTEAECPAVVWCPDGTAAPGNDVANCPVNCDILTGGGGPECDTEEPPPCIGSECTEEPPPEEPPPEEPPPEEPPTEEPPVEPPPEEPPVEPPPEEPPIEPPPEEPPVEPPPEEPPVIPPPEEEPLPPIEPPPPIINIPPPIINQPPNPDKSTDLTKQDLKDAQIGVETRLDNTNYELNELRSLLNSRTNTANGFLQRLDVGMQNLNNKAEYQGQQLAQISGSLGGINDSIDSLKDGLEGQALTEGQFNVEGGITSALGITGNESMADLTDESIELSDYRGQFGQFLPAADCPQNIPVSFNLLGSAYTFDLYYQPVCDFMSIAGTVVNWAAWLGVPFIVFGRRRAT